MRRRDILGAAGLAGVAPVVATAATAPVAAGPLRPVADHHQHLLSPTAADYLNRLDGAPATTAVDLPPPLAAVLAAHVSGWNNKAALLGLYAEGATLLSPDTRQWLSGRDKVADYMSGRFARPYRITPVAYDLRGEGGEISAYFTRGEGAAAKHFGSVHLSVRRDGDHWRISAASPVFPGPEVLEQIDAAILIKALDEAGIGRAVVLSLAYFFGDPTVHVPGDEAALVRAENDWTADQCARFPGRLAAFCSISPLRPYAAAELQRCATTGRFTGLKLHLGNSRVDLKTPAHAAQVRAVFAQANRLRLPIVAHLWTVDPAYGRPDAEIFLNQILPAAPDIWVQVAHMAGGGPGWTDEALEVYADAITRGDPRTRRLLFDVATVADGQSVQRLELMARRLRQIGLKRVLYGSDGMFGGRSTPRVEWGTFHGMVPLSEAEFVTVARNVAPYLT